jgi:hypothetical protein
MAAGLAIAQPMKLQCLTEDYGIANPIDWWFVYKQVMPNPGSRLASGILRLLESPHPRTCRGDWIDFVGC